MESQNERASHRANWAIALRSSTGTVRMRALGIALAEAPPQPEQKGWCLDLEVVHEKDTANLEKVLTIDVDSYERSSGPFKLFTTIIQESLGDGNSKGERRAIILRLVFSRKAGTIVRPDFLSYRLNGCWGVNQVVGFLDPLSSVAQTIPEQAASIHNQQEFVELLGNAVGGIIAQGTDKNNNVEVLRHHLDDEFSKRLAVPWVVHNTPLRSRIFWIQGRANIEASQQFYEAAKALGITLVVLDAPGHWLEDDDGPHSHYREAFIAVSVDGDEGLTQRIVDAVRAYPHRVDGIVTISDVRLPFVARACEILGLPTLSPAAYELAGDKGATRELESAASDGDEGFIIETPGELDHVLRERGDQLRYPLIVKPCTGWNSDCVVKVRDEEELNIAVRRASNRHAGSAKKSTKVVVEPYIDGPEVDANFVVLDGEVLFCDITDDFPCSGDLAGTEGTAAANFMETLMDVPSGLPESEKDMVQESLGQSIARLGFDSGVFHVEARVRGSRMKYELSSASGILDLHAREVDGTAGKPSCYLHEVNARPPGYINCVAALLAHGVDYYAIRLLLSLGSRENARVRALSQPFLKGKPQYVLGICVLPPTRGGVMASEDAVLDFLEANPQLARHVVHYQTVKTKGEVVQGPESSELWCVAYVIVASRHGRRECLELAQEVREKFNYRLVGE